MASYFTNRGKHKMLKHAFYAETVPTYYYVYLVTASASPTVDTNTWSELLANNSSNYSAKQLTTGDTNFDVGSQDGGSDDASVGIDNFAITASGGDCVARWAILTDDNGTEASREVYAVLDLGSERTVGNGQDLNINSTALKLT
jgi:hypothetical protein